ncbi:ATP-binding protein [Polaromonas sp. YR568]|uniref:AAA family ATPase n=1 Tax=Polaromonas sp. YR568 TaxID=1855301 RepID=UPI00313833E6
MAYVSAIKIEGLLGRSETIEFQLQRDVNIIFGDNGCGKTTLLKIIDAALSRDAEAIQRLPVTKAEIHIYSEDHKKLIKHSWERKKGKDSTLERIHNMRFQAYLAQAEIIDDPRSLMFDSVVEPNQWKLTPSLKDKETKRWAHTFLPTTRLYLTDRSSRAAASRSQLSEAQLDELFAESVNRAWLVYYSKALQEVRGIQEEGLRAVLHNVLFTGLREPAVPSTNTAEIYDRVVNFLNRQPTSGAMVLGSLEQFNKRYESDGNLRRSVDNINAIERRIESTMLPIDRFKATIESLFSRGKKISILANQLQVTLITGETVSAANLSSGEKHMLKILLSAMTAAGNSVLIDEPELSMHIDWQRLFVQTVQALNPDCQLILASHSPEIMADISDEKIFKI